MNAFPPYRIGQRVHVVGDTSMAGKVGYYYSTGRFGVMWDSGVQAWYDAAEWGIVIIPLPEEDPPPTQRARLI